MGTRAPGARAPAPTRLRPQPECSPPNPKEEDTMNEDTVPLTTAAITTNADDVLVFPLEPPIFHTRANRFDDDGRAVESLLVMTDGAAFSHVAAAWPGATNEERGTLFWAAGQVHLCEAEIARLEPASRSTAMERLLGLDRGDPRGLTPKLVEILRALGATSSTPARRVAVEEAAAYRRLRIIRASGPYHPVGETLTLVCLQSGIVSTGFQAT